MSKNYLKLELKELDKALFEFNNEIVEWLKNILKNIKNDQFSSLIELSDISHFRFLYEDSEDKAEWMLSTHSFLGYNFRKCFNIPIVGYKLISIVQYTSYVCKVLPSMTANFDKKWIMKILEHLISSLKLSNRYYWDKDVEQLLALVNNDRKVDKFYESFIEDISDNLKNTTDKKEVDDYMRLTIVAKKLELSGDLIVEIIKELIYVLKSVRYDLRKQVTNEPEEE